MFSGIVEEKEEGEKKRRKEHEVKAEKMLELLLNLSSKSMPTPADVRRSLTKHRLKLLHALYQPTPRLTPFHQLSSDFL